MVIVLLLFYFKAVACAILHGPSNMAIVEGTNMTMTCEPTPGTNTIDWYYTPVHSKDKTPTLLRINHGSRLQKNFSEFSVEGKIPGQFLSLNITQLKQAGFYQCTATGQTAKAQLVILASEPQCNVSSHVLKEEVTRVDLFCSVSYNGYWAPVMEWSQTTVGNTNARVIPINDYVIETIENELTSYLSLVINSSTRGFRYSCKTYFKNISSFQTSTTASNTPKYESIWTSPVIQMLYGPKNVIVFPMKYVFHPGDVLTCSSDSTLSPEFEWTEMETGNVFKGPIIVINASMLRDEPYVFSCKAINKLTRAYVTSSPFIFTVKCKVGEDESNVTTDNSAKDGLETTLGISAYMVPLIILILLCFISLLVVTTVKKINARVMRSVNIEIESENQNNDYDSQNGYSRDFSSRTDAEVINDNRLRTGRRIFERVGADGTVYMEMSKIQPQEVLSNPRKPISPQIFNKSVYASIDHGLEPPPLSSK